MLDLTIPQTSVALFFLPALDESLFLNANDDDKFEEKNTGKYMQLFQP